MTELIVFAARGSSTVQGFSSHHIIFLLCFSFLVFCFVATFLFLLCTHTTRRRRGERKQVRVGGRDAGRQAMVVGGGLGDMLAGKLITFPVGLLLSEERERKKMNNSWDTPGTHRTLPETIRHNTCRCLVHHSLCFLSIFSKCLAVCTWVSLCCWLFGQRGVDLPLWWRRLMCPFLVIRVTCFVPDSTFCWETIGLAWASLPRWNRSRAATLEERHEVELLSPHPGVGKLVQERSI